MNTPNCTTRILFSFALSALAVSVLCLFKTRHKEFILQLNTVGSLSQLKGKDMTDGCVVFASGYAQTGDNGGGLFIYDANIASRDATSVVPLDRVGIFRRLERSPVNVKWFGASGNGKSDDTEAIQAAINSASPGEEIYIPVGHYRISKLTLRNGKRLRGSGASTTVDALGTFGDSGYSATNVEGTVLTSVSRDGTALSVIPSTTTQCQITNIALIGPGSGDSAGIGIGTAERSIVKGMIQSVYIFNFRRGLVLENVNDCAFYDVVIRGCASGLSLKDHVNNNGFFGLDIQRCGNGLVFESSACLGNAFYNPIFQANTEVGAQIRGRQQVLYTPYFESNGLRALEFRSARSCVIINASVQGKPRSSNIFIDKTSHFIALYDCETDATFTVENQGYGTFITGLLSRFVDSGINTVSFDYNNARFHFPNLP